MPLPRPPATLEELITQIVMLEVERYNSGDAGQSKVLTALTEEQIADQLDAGKVGFGARYNANQQDPVQAIENALLSYKDGLYKVYINDREIERLEEQMQLQENDRVMFIRLTMLAGRMW
ncbi:hypothetical protein SAMN05518855_100817 [Paenibacillus sp. CF384]|nr:hypothetical protein SAMN05518855_100817 [Paenibacillus sp. CF384]